MRPLIVALDVETDEEALRLTKKLASHVDLFKVGPVLFLKYGGPLLERLQRLGAKIFLDLKFHDIPSVVQKAVERAGEWGVYSATVHAAGGKAMLEAASRATHRPRLWGVTVLTSLDQKDLGAIGIQRTVKDQVDHLAQIAKAAGLDGVIASVQETKDIKKRWGNDFSVVTPGIRLVEDADDQKRIQTPVEAVKSGADFFVMGRPIIQAADPVAAVQSIYDSLSSFTGGSRDAR